MAETGLVENNSESGSSSQSQGTSSEGSTQSNSHHSSHQQSTSESHEVSKHTAIAADEGREMDEESPLVINHDKRGVPTSSDVHSNEDSELSSPPPDDGSSGGEQVYMDERSMHPPPPPYVLSPASMVPVVEHGGFISPGTHPPVLLMTAIQSEGFSSDRELNESPLHGAELRKQLVTQLEYYFSKENLSSDKYLSSQMDGDHYVPISIVASFNQVKRLTSDVNLIRDAVTESSVLQLDETGGKVRAVPEKRCVLILREIPKNTPEKDITALFASDKCPNYSSCEFADNDCWYITFDSEEDTQKAHKYLREEVREFLGHPIRARIKGTTVQRSSGMPKKNRNVTYPMQSVYNGTPQIPAFYQQPPGPSVVPWPQATSPGYFEAAAAVSGASNFVHFVSNPQQQAFAGPPNRYPNVPIYMLDGEPPVGGRGGARSVPPSGNPRPPHMDRGHSPRPLPNGDIHTERERVPERGGGGAGGRGQRGGDHYSGGGGGGRYRSRGDEDQSKKIPRLNKNKRSNGATGDSGDRGQLPPRQQPKPQHKFELAQSNFPPLPTSSDGGGLSTPHPTVTQSQSHMTSGVDDSSSSRPTVSDIVRGKHLKESQPSSTSSPLSATVVPSHQHALNSMAVPAPPPVTTAANPTTSSTSSSAAMPLSTSVTSTSTTVAEKRPPPPQAAAPASAPPPISTTTTPISTVSSAVTHSQHSQPQPTTSQSQSQQVNSSQISQQPNSSVATGSTTTSTSSISSSSSSSSVSSSNSGVNSVTGTSGASISTPATQTASTVITTSQVVSSGNQSATTKPSQVSQAPPLPLPLSTTATTSMTSAASTPSSTAPATSISTPSVPVSQSTSTAVSHHQPQTLAQTASQVVAMGIPAAPSTSTSTTTATSTAGGGAVGVVSANQSHQTASSRQGPPQAKAQRPDSKGFSREGRPYSNYNNYNSYSNGANNKGGAARYHERDYQNRSNYRNPQVSKMDNRPFQSNGRGRYYNNNRDRDNYTRGRPGFNNHNRSQQLKPSPKTAKKNPQAPPPPPTSTTPTPQGDAKSTPAAPTNNEPATSTTTNSSNSNTTSSATGATGSNSGASKTEKLSYAQMAQKKASAPPPPLPKASTGAGGNSQSSNSTASAQTATTPSGTSSGSTTLSTSQQQQATSSKTVSAPTSPQGQQGQMTLSAGGQVPNGSVPSSSGASTLAAKQSNSMKTGKSGLSGSSGQLSAPAHAALTASKSAPASPQKEKLTEAVKSS